ncbi:prepilin-type N-terminal cleavage/methylation domain-containing protein [uncultured Clostridium sp.]|uniref:prepilin-type N-terminal cleavage/methylation domain-containing protein n=1 Tax=uncultured Clostridium sp. TaxID=59620 RepID=UPI0026376C4A|nr:prepilin-type N-terminal cleavage/methylation domain-containing protein [uncultured Clostridium sp.]
MIKNLRKKSKKKGFTLIELVIVLAVLAIIALIAIPNFTKVREDSKIKADLRTGDVIKRAAQMSITDEDFEILSVAGADGVKFIITPSATAGTDATITIQAGTGVAAGGVNPANLAEFKIDATDNTEVANDMTSTTGYENFVAALREVDLPQEKDKVAYEIVIDITDTVTSVGTVEAVTP